MALLVPNGSEDTMLQNILNKTAPVKSKAVASTGNVVVRVSRVAIVRLPPSRLYSDDETLETLLLCGALNDD